MERKTKQEKIPKEKIYWIIRRDDDGHYHGVLFDRHDTDYYVGPPRGRWLDAWTDLAKEYRRLTGVRILE